jgi:hypothetical protein
LSEVASIDPTGARTATVRCFGVTGYQEDEGSQKGEWVTTKGAKYTKGDGENETIVARGKMIGVGTITAEAGIVFGAPARGYLIDLVSF